MTLVLTTNSIFNPTQSWIAKALAAKQPINESDIDGVLEEKQQAIRPTGILEFVNSRESLKTVDWRI
jgi:aspartokinase-like uncharacterized kinase